VEQLRGYIHRILLEEFVEPKEAKVGTKVSIPNLLGWEAIRGNTFFNQDYYGQGEHKELMFWSIYKNDRPVGKIYDDGILHIFDDKQTFDTYKKNELINNPIQAAKYIHRKLVMAKNKKLKGNSQNDEPEQMFRLKESTK